MKIKVNSSYSGAISTGPYENARPGFAAEIELEIKVNDVNRIKELQQELHKVCYENFKSCEENAILEKIHKERKDFRWYKDEENKDVPSVTSIIGFDLDMFIKPDELQQYASQSQLAHAQVSHYIDTKKWVEPKELPEVWSDLVIVTKGSLNLETSGWSFPDFLQKYPIKDLKNTKPSINQKHRYGGTPDCEGIPVGWDKIKGLEGVLEVPTIFDVKRTQSKIKDKKQQAAYAKMKGYEHIKQIATIPLNNKTQQGFSKPSVDTRVDQYFGMFLQDREAFKKRFGI